MDGSAALSQEFRLEGKTIPDAVTNLETAVEYDVIHYGRPKKHRFARKKNIHTIGWHGKVKFTPNINSKFQGGAKKKSTTKGFGHVREKCET